VGGVGDGGGVDEREILIYYMFVVIYKHFEIPA